MKETVANKDLMIALYQSLRSVAPDGELNGASTKLLGVDAVLDSTGFLEFLVSAGEALGNTVDLSGECREIYSEKLSIGQST